MVATMNKTSLNDLIKALNGKVIANEFEVINENVALSKQLTSLDEDMLLVEFGNNLDIDIGWYCHFKDGDSYETSKGSGRFRIYVLQNRDWDNPLLRIKTKSFDGLKRAIKKAQAVILKNLHI